MSEISFVYEDENGVECEAKLPCKKIVCPKCSGKGKIVNPAIDGNGLTKEDFDEDPGFFEDYMAGVYDIQCPKCNGANVVDEIDETKADPKLLERYYAMEADAHFVDEIAEMERRYGA